MSYPDEKHELIPSYSGSYQNTINRDPQTPLIIENNVFYGVASIEMLVNYYFVEDSPCDMDLDMERLTLLNIEGDEIADLGSISDKELIRLGFPYAQELEKAKKEAEC